MTKGQATALIQILAGLLIISLIMIVIYTFLSKYLELEFIVRGHEVERHAINSANVLLSSRAIALEDRYRVYRGLLDAEKLDRYFIGKVEVEGKVGPWHAELVERVKEVIELMNALIKEGELKEMAYPNSVVWLAIVDRESGAGWFSVARGEITKELGPGKLIECLLANIKPTFRASDLFKLPPLTTGDIWEYRACGADFASEFGITIKGFPVAIRYPDGRVNAGRMIVWLMEI
jgi:hypothetical protein